MKEIFKVEQKRIFSHKHLKLLILILLIFSVITSLKTLNNYEVYDSNGQLILSSQENLNESKSPSHLKVLDESLIKEVVMRVDQSKYLYNSNLVNLIATNYETKLDALTDKDISQFYEVLHQNISDNFGGAALVSEIEQASLKAKQEQQPIVVGYAEGWKVLNNDLIDFTTILVLIIPFILLPLFGEEPKSNMRALCMSTKQGKQSLVLVKMLVGLYVSVKLYTIAIIIFTLSRLFVFGFSGVNLPIQNSVNYLFCPYYLTYGQQYMINVLIGLLALLVMVGLVYIFTILTEQLLSGAVCLTFVVVIMMLLPNNNFMLNHYFKNFLPYQMTNFNNYYLHPEIYKVFGEIIPQFQIVMLIVCIVFISLMGCVFLMSKNKLVRPLK